MYIIQYMYKNSTGSLPDIAIKRLITEGVILNARFDDVKPASLDLRVDLKTIVEVPSVFLPSKNRFSIPEILDQFQAKNIYTEGATCIEPGKTYVAEVVESVDFSKDPEIFARVNPKSSSGRVDIHVQLLANYTPAYDTVFKGYTGKLYVLLRSKSFKIIFNDDIVSLNQMMFFKGKRNLVSENDLEDVIETGILRNNKKDISLKPQDVIKGKEKIELSLDLKDLGSICGYVAKENVQKPLIWKKAENNKEDFFEPIENISADEGYIFKKDRFYILSSREAIHIPRDYACEMISFDDTLGEFRSHYAGFIDNGWGENGHRPLTLELRCNEDIYMYHGQPIAYMVLDHMTEPVEKSYDQIDSNYLDQLTARLGKFFK